MRIKVEVESSNLQLSFK
uniref:Uncharacterized protein n=1 Tax=Rhizophora mucronata TaxID=61149 RepID=A0A2P2NIP0_RHIMU